MPGTLEKDGTFRVDGDMTEPRSRMLSFGEVVFFSTPSPDHPTWNEDSAAVVTCGQIGVLVVSDGAGGTAGGARASSITIGSLQEALRDRGAGDGIRSAVLDAIEQANAKIRRQVPGALATVALLVVDGMTARAVSVGDSICAVIGGRGRLKYRSLAHGPTGFAEEAGMLDEGEALLHEERHLVSNMLGLEGMRVEVGVPIRLAPRDTLLVACDALFDNARLDEISRTLCRGPLQAGVDALRRLVAERMAGEGSPSHADDLTILACRPPRNRPRSPATGDSTGQGGTR